MGQREDDIALLRRLLVYDFDASAKDAFGKMQEDLTDEVRVCLSQKQRAWAKEILERFEPLYENLVSSGAVPNKTKVETLPILQRSNLPMRPPQRRRDDDG